MYCINPESDEPIFLIDCQIGKDDENPSDPYIDGAMFVRELLYMDGEGKKKIWIWINSPGGSVTDGEAIYGAILKTKTKVNTFCYGSAYSIAGVIFQAGYKRGMLENARLMYHNAFDPTAKPGEETKSLDIINAALNTMVSTRSWKDPEAVKKMMEKETFISAQDALAADLCDYVEKNDELNAPKARDFKAIWKFRETVLNKIQNKNTTDMTKIEAIKKLNLKDDATDEQIFKAMSEALDKFKNSSDELAKMKTDMENLKNAGKTAEYDDLKAKFDALEKNINDKNAADNAAIQNAEKEKKVAAAKTKILASAKARNITLSDDQLKNYVALAGTEDTTLKAVTDTIDALPMSKKAPVIAALNKDQKEKPAIEADGVDEQGLPKAKDTSRFVASMNAKVFNASKKRFSGSVIEE